MRFKKKKWSDDFNDDPRLIKAEEDFLNIFRKDNLELEIGCGKGGFIIQKAQQYKNKIFVGVEKNKYAVGYILKDIHDLEIDNLFVLNQNIDEIFDFIPHHSINNIYLNFSDPWPKKRHHKNRLTAQNRLYRYSYILKEHGKIYFKTDNEELFMDSLYNLQNSYFNVLRVEEDYQLDENDICTEYEKKFRDLGEKIYFIIAENTYSD
jgi:tRNA (guanine-N7-)-methyltransferase